MPDLRPETDVSAVVLFTFEDREFWVSPATLLQCLQIAANEGRVPPLPADWINRAIPPAYRMRPRGEGEILSQRPARPVQIPGER